MSAVKTPSTIGVNATSSNSPAPPVNSAPAPAVQTTAALTTTNPTSGATVFTSTTPAESQSEGSVTSEWITEPAASTETPASSATNLDSVVPDPSSAEPSTDATGPSSALCTSKCALGSTCSTIQQCASLRCDEVCQPTEFVVHSDGLDAVSTSIKMHIELYGDPAVPVAWRDFALLYFFTAEKRDDFKLNYAQGGGTALPMQVTLDEWILVWTTEAPGNVPSTVTDFDVQLHSYPWLPDTPESNNNANDYSYREGKGDNDKIVLCRLIDGEWRHIQGTPPPSIPDPCHYVNNCDAAIACDPLEPSP